MAASCKVDASLVGFRDLSQAPFSVCVAIALQTSERLLIDASRPSTSRIFC